LNTKEEKVLKQPRNPSENIKKIFSETKSNEIKIPEIKQENKLINAILSNVIRALLIYLFTK
tara:strand:- start:2159 stop:2344 length:186 start_codon:yes stop_codon:yes gene_type:complete